MNEIRLNQQITPLNREERFLKVQELTELFTNGDQNPLDLYLIFKGWMETIKATLENEQVKTAIDVEVDKMPKTFEQLNCKVTRASKKTYDYSTSNDSVYNELSMQLETLKSEIKVREVFLKSIPFDGTVNPATGEIINKPNYSETDYLRITF